MMQQPAASRVSSVDSVHDEEEETHPHSPVPELWADGEERRRLGLMWRVQTEERVVLHTRLPQILTRPVTHHIEADQVLQVLILGHTESTELLILEEEGR